MIPVVLFPYLLLSIHGLATDLENMAKSVKRVVWGKVGERRKTHRNVFLPVVSYQSTSIVLDS